MSEPLLALRPLTPADFPLLLEWLARPHVREWWDDGEDTLEKVVDNYSKSDPGEEVTRFVLLYAEPDASEMRPIGYFQYWRSADGTTGIDQFIAEEGLLGQGIGTRAIGLLLDRLIQHHNPRRITVDPEPENRRAIRCYEKAGFRHYATVTTAEGKPAYMMQIER
jgi:RimJ/RimL family protein N-acetyltransferase